MFGWAGPSCQAYCGCWSGVCPATISPISSPTFQTSLYPIILPINNICTNLNHTPPYFKSPINCPFFIQKIEISSIQHTKSLAQLIPSFLKESKEVLRQWMLSQFLEQFWNIEFDMSVSQSKLMLQLSKEQRVCLRTVFNEQVIEDIYSTICKLQPKNLMLVEFLGLVIEKEFVRNSHKLAYFADLYEEVRGKNLDQQHGYVKTGVETEEQKFSRKKFIKLLKEMAKKLYPGSANAYQTVLFDRLVRNESDDHRIKLDDSVKKMLTRDTISTLTEFDRELQGVFEAYMPDNYNMGLEFSWEEIKVLEKKLPIICFLRFIHEAELLPNFISPAQFMEIISKLKPPALPNSSSSKEAMFYTSETMAAYLRDNSHLPHIKLLEGDLGLTFFEMQILFVKLAAEFAKDPKGEHPANIRKLAGFLRLKEAFDEHANRRSRYMQTIRGHIKLQSNKSEKIVVKKRQSRKKIEDLYDSKDSELKEEATKNVYRNMSIQFRQIEAIKRDLDCELPELPQRRKVEKENEGYFDVGKKHIVIGEQLPKIQDKNKPAAPKDAKKKNEDVLLGYKPQNVKIVEQSNIGKLVKRPKKMRLNTQFPIVLNEIFYPSDLGSQLFLNPKAQLYLETSYIHLGERLYEQAFLNYTKAKMFTESKSSMTEFYYNIHAAQIFESAGRDDLALSFYHRAKELLGVLTSIEGAVRSHPYIGMGSCLYHMQEYEYALRCFQKARSVFGPGLQGQSLQNAILQNDVGCCLMMLNRNQQAIKYFEIAHNILDLKIGCFDERTLVVQQNFNKNRKAYLEMMPEFKTMWKTYMEKSTTKLPAVKSATKMRK